MQIIGYHITCIQAVNSLGERPNGSILDFLLEYKPDSIKVMYHLDYCVANLFRALQVPAHDLKKLLNNGSLYLAPYTFNYIPKKYFNVQHGAGRGAPFANFNDMYQFHRNSDITEHEPEWYAMEAARIGSQVYEALLQLGLSPTSLVSPVRCWEKEVLAHMDLPELDDIPEQAAKLAYDCCEGGWVEAFQKGHFDKTYDYDVRSAYGSFTRGLLDTRYGKWRNDPFYDPVCYYGYALCDIEVTAPISPITFKTEDDEKITPTGKFPKPKVLSKRYLNFIDKYKIANVRVIDGWWWHPDKLVCPFETMIDELYRFKESAYGMAKDVYKRILAGIWGKFLQTNSDSFGDLFNPVWAEEVETGCRLTTAAFIYDNKLEKNTLHVAVDGVLSSRPVELAEQGAIGEWKLTNVGAAYVISSGICAVQGKEYQIDSDKENSDFILRYDWLKDQIAANPNAHEYTMSKLSPVTVQKAVTQNKMQTLGQHEEIVKTIDITFESKRSYDQIPETGRQLQRRHYMSEPYSIDLIMSYRDHCGIG